LTHVYVEYEKGFPVGIIERMIVP